MPARYRTETYGKSQIKLAIQILLENGWTRLQVEDFFLDANRGSEPRHSSELENRRIWHGQRPDNHASTPGARNFDQNQ